MKRYIYSPLLYVSLWGKDYSLDENGNYWMVEAEVGCLSSAEEVGKWEIEKT
jgi:hypothetical protein